VQIFFGGIRLRDRLSRLMIGVTDLGQGSLPLLVVYGGRNKHYTLLWLVEGEVGEGDLVELMLLGINVTDGSIPDGGPDTVPARLSGV